MEVTEVEMGGDEGGYRIGDVARLTGIPGRRIRFYEERGLLTPAARSGAGYRLYGESEVARLEFIKRAKTLGLTLNEIKNLVSVADGCTTGEISYHLEAVLDGKLRQTRQRISELTTLEANLQRFRSRAAALERGELHSTCDVRNTGEPVGFCGCLDTVTDISGEEVDMDIMENVKDAPCTCNCSCCNDSESSCTCACECCADCA